MWVVDAETLRFLAVNQAAVEHYGYSESEFLTMTTKDIRASEDVPELMAWLKESDQGYRSRLARHRRKDGTLFQVEISAHVIEFRGRKARLVQADDVSERERIAGALRESEQRLSILAAATLEGIAISENGRLMDVNEQMAQMLGYPREELLGQEIAALVPSEWRERVMQNILAGRESHIEHEMLRKDGTRVMVEAHGQTVEMQGRHLRFTTLRDITRSQRAEQALRESEAKYRQLNELMPAAVYACDCDGRIWFYNERAVALWGGRPPPMAPARDYCGCHGALLAEGRPVPLDQLPISLACRQGQSFRNVEGLIQRPDGSRVDVLVNLDPVRDQAGKVVGVITVLTDITERKRTEAALQKQNQRLALLNEAALQLLSVEEPDSALAGIYERIAGSFQTSGFFEFEVSEAGDELRLKSCVGIGEPGKECGSPRIRMDEGILGTVAQKRQAIILGHVQQSEDPKTGRLKELGVRAYACYPLVVGERLLGTLSFASRQRDSFEAEDVSFFETLASYLAQARERQRLRHELERYAADLERTVQERTSKLQELVSDLEHMSHSIVHDMRAPLRAIQGYATIIAQIEGERLSPRSRELFERVATSTQRMDLLITDVLNYNRAVREELPLQPVDVGRLLRNMVRAYPELQPERADVRLEGEFPPVLGHEGGLTQCFANLLDNAVKFVRPGAKPQVRVWADTRGEPAKVRVWVEDQGTGMPPQGQEKIFRMFGRLHGSEYEGTGIGLALVRKVVERMGGRVGVESVERKGSRFWLELPAARPPESEPASGSTAPSAVSRG